MTLHKVDCSRGQPFLLTNLYASKKAGSQKVTLPCENLSHEATTPPWRVVP